MPPAVIPKQEVLNRIIDEFKQWGYDGATLSRLSRATGLVKASLYHYFPKGKPDMAAAVLDHLLVGFGELVVQPLNQQGSATEKIERMIEGLLVFYEDGKTSCALEVLSLGTAAELFGERIRQTFVSLRDVLARMVADNGYDLATSVRNAEVAISIIQGALVTGRGLQDPQLFRRVLNQLPSILLAA